MLFKQLASLNKPSSDYIYECCVCLAMSQHYLNTTVEAHSIYPCLTIFLFSSGSTENTHMQSMEKPMSWSSHSGNLRERVASNRLVVKENSHIKYTKKRDKNPEKLKTVSNFVVGSQIHWGLILGKRWVHWDSVILSPHFAHFKTVLEGSSTWFTCKKVSQKALKTAMIIVMSSTKNALGHH